MVDLLKEVEAIPSSYADVTLYLNDTPGWSSFPPENRTVSVDLVWQRIEAWTRTRYTDREVIWIIEGAEGDNWTPPLTPITSLFAGKWESDTWASTTLPDGPLGYCLPCDGTFRVTAQVGGGDVPEAVAEAVRRLHEYSTGIAHLFENQAAEVEGVAHNHTARALQLSGAADLLRPNRRQK